MPLNCSLVGCALEGGAFSDIIENINVSEVNDHKNLPISSLVEESHQAREFVGLILSKLHLTCPFQDKRILQLKPCTHLITDPFADFPKDVGGHDAHKGDSEELGEERGVGADDCDAGQPEAGAALGEKGLGSDRGVGYSESHRVRPQHLSNSM